MALSGGRYSEDLQDSRLCEADLSQQDVLKDTEETLQWTSQDVCEAPAILRLLHQAEMQCRC